MEEISKKRRISVKISRIVGLAIIAGGLFFGTCGNSTMCQNDASISGNLIPITVVKPEKTVYGLVCGPATELSDYNTLYGAQIGCVNHASTFSKLYGFQLGLANINDCSKLYGFQLGVLNANNYFSELYGAQIGIWNEINEGGALSGASLGLINLIEGDSSDLRGVQIGVVNGSDKNIFPFLRVGLGKQKIKQ